MNNTTLGIAALCAVGVGAMMWDNKSERIKQKEEDQTQLLYKEVKKMEDDFITPENQDVIARQVIQNVPLIETAFERDIWRETLSGHIQAFLALDGGFTTAEEFFTLSSDEGTQNVLRGMSLADINDLTQTGSFEDVGFEGARLIPGTKSQTIHISFRDIGGFVTKSIDWVNLCVLFDYVLTKRSFIDGVTQGSLLSGVDNVLASFFSNKLLVTKEDFDDTDFASYVLDLDVYDENPQDLASLLNGGSTDKFFSGTVLTEMKDAFKTKYLGDKFTDEDFDMLMNMIIDISLALATQTDFTSAHAYYSDDIRDQLKIDMYDNIGQLADKLADVGADLPYDLPTSVAEFKELIEREGVTVSDVTELHEQVEATTTFEELADLMSSIQGSGMSPHLKQVFLNLVTVTPP